MESTQEDYTECWRRLGFDFNAKFSFFFGVNFPIPSWYGNLKNIHKKLWFIYCGFGYLMTSLLFVSNIVMICQEYQDIRVFTTCSGTISYIICFIIKTAIFRNQMKILNKVLDSIQHISKNFDNNPLEDKRFFEIHKSYFHHVKIFGIGKNLAIAGGVSTLALFEIASRYFNPQHRMLPMSGWFPYDTYTDTGFYISCIFQLVSYLSFLLKDVAVDLIFLNFLVSFNSCMIYLRKLLKIILQDEASGKSNTNLYTKQDNLLWWIKEYQLVLRTIEDFKIISNPYLFAKYISVAVILFFGGVLVTSDVEYDLVQQMIVLSINMSNLFQLYIFSVMGNNITENGLRVAEEGFHVDLIQEKRSTKRLYYFTLCRSTKPVEIQFGNINPLSVHSFGQIVKMCFSYFTTVVQVRSEST